ncbi:MAG: glycosyltransferase family 2 protein [Candidatus Daviesbacteria bacterium]|nr:MAG: glycosyltransferase family 2 protein [Candidatus Daviesbacteria bacterium]
MKVLKKINNNLSVVIVNFNSGDFLVECLDSLEQVKNEVNLEIWVVDNASLDTSIKKARKKYPHVNYLLEKQNLGFGKANNLALRQIKNEYILILNPDSQVLPGTLELMLNFMKENPDVGASTCRVEKADGTLDWASHRGWPTPEAAFRYYFLGDDSLYHLTKRPMSKAHEIDALAGAFMLTRKSVLEKTGLFDEDYWLYGEDLDLCFRIKQNGFKIMYVPEVKVLHLKGVASGLKKHSQNISTATRQSQLRAFNSFYETMKIFYQKHLEKNYPFFINWLVFLGINLKWALAKRNLTV